jgi:DNA-binding transcriptional regulator YdaS (Cro superfamily)
MEVNKTDTKRAEPLAKAIRIIGTMTGLARNLGVSKGAVFQWGMPGRQVPAEYCPEIERLTKGAVKCEDLRPDVDWGVLRGSRKKKPALESE